MFTRATRTFAEWRAAVQLNAHLVSTENRGAGLPPQIMVDREIGLIAFFP
jgi:hypothetical protein